MLTYFSNQKGLSKTILEFKVLGYDDLGRQIMSLSKTILEFKVHIAFIFAILVEV